MLRTNSNKFKANIKQEILNSIPEEWGATDEDKLTALKSDFCRVANYPANMLRLPNDQDRLADYLQGLPIGLEYSNYEILELDKRLREYSNDLPEAKQNSLLENYWSFMAYHIMKIW